MHSTGKHALENRIKFLTYLSLHPQTTRNKTDVQIAKEADAEINNCLSELFKLKGEIFNA